MNIEVKKVRLELMKVSTAKAEMEIRIHERLEEIERIKEHMKIQETKEQELNVRLKELEK